MHPSHGIIDEEEHIYSINVTSYSTASLLIYLLLSLLYIEHALKVLASHPSACLFGRAVLKMTAKDRQFHQKIF